MIDPSEAFFKHFEPYLSLPTGYVGGELDLLRFGRDGQEGICPRFIEIEGGHLEVELDNGDVVTTRDYAGFDKFYGPVRRIIQAGSTATAIQVFW